MERGGGGGGLRGCVMSCIERVCYERVISEGGL